MVLKLEFEHDFENKIREQAMRRFGYSKGALKSASREAYERWLREKESPIITSKRDPFKTLRGAMKHLRGKKTSVQLQHEALQLWAKQN